MYFHYSYVFQNMENLTAARQICYDCLHEANAISIPILTYSFIIKDFRETAVGILSPKLPDIKERLPVNVFYQPLQVIIFKDFCADEFRFNCRNQKYNLT